VRYSSHLFKPNLHGFLYTKESGKVVTLKEGLYDLKAVASKQLKVFVNTVGNKNVLERFTFSQNFILRIAIASLEIIVKINKKAIHV
jgi:hypothetical protein